MKAHHTVQTARHSLCFEGELSGLFLIVRWVPSGALTCSFSQRKISIAPNSFCMWGCGLWCLTICALFGLCFLQNWPCILVIQFCSQSKRILAGCGYSCNSSCLVDVCLRLNFVGVRTLFSAQSSGKGMGIVVFLALMVLGSEVVLLQALNPSSGLSSEVLKTHEPG